MSNIRFAFSGFILLLFLSACNGDKDQFDGDYYSGIDNGIISSEFSNIRNLVDYEARQDTFVYKNAVHGSFCPGAVISVTPSGTNQGTMMIDFGGGCVCMDSRMRTGKLKVEFNGKWRNANSTLNIIPQGYTVNTWPMSFNYELTCKGPDNQNHPRWTATTTNAQLAVTEGLITWEGSQTILWTEGENTPNYTDDNIYEISGSGTGKTRYGLAFTWEITDPLIAKLNCQNIVDGAVSIKPLGYDTRTINFGTGQRSCDDFATLTVGTFSTQIQLP